MTYVGTGAGVYAAGQACPADASSSAQPMTEDETELIHSPLTQSLKAEGHTLRIEIYRSEGEPWILEIVDESGTSTVWDDGFETDTAALAEGLSALEQDGVHHFVLEAQKAAQAAAPELLRKLPPSTLLTRWRR